MHYNFNLYKSLLQDQNNVSFPVGEQPNISLWGKKEKNLYTSLQGIWVTPQTSCSTYVTRLPLRPPMKKEADQASIALQF